MGRSVPKYLPRCQHVSQASRVGEVKDQPGGWKLCKDVECQTALHTSTHLALGVECGERVVCVPLAAGQPARRLGARPGLVPPGPGLRWGCPREASVQLEIARSRLVLRPPAPRAASGRGS